MVSHAPALLRHLARDRGSRSPLAHTSLPVPPAREPAPTSVPQRESLEAQRCEVTHPVTFLERKWQNQDCGSADCCG